MNDINIIKKNIAVNIKTLRNKKKLTQNELANLLGVTKSVISAYENETRTPSLEIIVALANVFEIDPGQLLADESKPINTTQTISIKNLTKKQIEILIEVADAFQAKNR